jgi:hypothetical protein
MLALVVYLRTMAPGVYGFDSAELATGAYTLGIVHPPGYPLYLLLVRFVMLVPIGSFAYRANLFSGIMGALSVGIVARLAHRLTGRRWAGWLGGLALGFGLEFWRMSIVAEVYTLQTTLVALCLMGVYEFTESGSRSWLALAALAYGLSLANHVSAALYLPALVWALAGSASKRGWIRAVGIALPAIGIGLLFYLYLPLRAAAHPPLNYVDSYYGVDLTTWSGLWWMVSAESYRFFSFGYDLNGYLGELVSMMGSLLRNFTGLGVILGVIGWTSWFRSRSTIGRLAAWVFASTSLFVAGYAVADKNTMYLPAYLMWSLALAAGAARAAAWVRELALPWLYPGLLPRLFGASAVAMLGLSASLTWRVVDLSRMTEPEQFALRTFRTVERGAVVVGNWSPAVILEYFQEVEGWRPDVEVFNRSRFEVAEYYRQWAARTPHSLALARVQESEEAALRELAGVRAIYDVEYNAGLATAFEYQPIGNLFRLVPLQQ